MSLARRTIASTAWTSIGTWASWLILLSRGVFLARWLPVETFGVYALVSSVIGLVTIVAEFGLAGAFVHRAPETEDEEQLAAVHFTLKLISATALVILLGLGAFLFSSGALRTAFLVLTVTTGVSQLTQTPKRILVRRVVHRRLALLKLVDAVVSTLVGLWLAWQGATLWALLSSNISTVALAIFALYVWKPVWRPRLTWSPRVMHYFLSFGGRSVLSDVLYQALNRIDDLWVGFYLGDTPLGFYSKAYSFATYPRLVLGGPVNTVAMGTYAELKTKRLQLSQAFFRLNALLVRSGFFMGGGLVLIAPEVIRTLLGDRWMPMLDAFRLMLVFCLLDPITRTTGSLFIAVGRPQWLVKTRLAQLIVLVICLYVAGPLGGIIGISLAMDGMVAFGIGLLLWQARKYVDFSIRKLFLAPLIALGIALFLSHSALLVPGVPGADWRTAAMKAGVFVSAYAGTLILFERREVQEVIAYVRASFGLDEAWQLLHKPSCRLSCSRAGLRSGEETDAQETGTQD
ncbi:MAG: oligosaccharide flippase family protein [Anaerolineae bacterium]|jgi:O-antigen/teichoic acid export membrane protein